jgi:hypothetical protein
MRHFRKERGTRDHATAKVEETDKVVGLELGQTMDQTIRDGGTGRPNPGVFGGR